MRDDLEIYREISWRLEQRRTDIGMSKRRLAALSGITPVYLREVLRGDRRPSILILMTLCNALDIRMSELFAHIESKNEIPRQLPIND